MSFLRRRIDTARRGLAADWGRVADSVAEARAAQARIALWERQDRALAELAGREAELRHERDAIAQAVREDADLRVKRTTAEERITELGSAIDELLGHYRDAVEAGADAEALVGLQLRLQGLRGVHDDHLHRLGEILDALAAVDPLADLGGDRRIRLNAQIDEVHRHRRSGAAALRFVEQEARQVHANLPVDERVRQYRDPDGIRTLAAVQLRASIDDVVPAAGVPSASTNAGD